MKAFLILLITALTACVSTNTRDCQETDWYELGRRRGAQGLSPKEVKAHCSGTSDLSAQAAYTSGHHTGLVEFCSTASGFEIGKSGHDKPTVCPPPLETTFSLGYERGKKAYNIELSNRLIEAKIQSISEQLYMKPLDELAKQSLQNELKQLEKTLSHNQELISKLEE